MDRPQIPASGKFALLNCSVPTVLLGEGAATASDVTLVDIEVDAGRISSVCTPSASTHTESAFDMAQKMLFPCFVDMHAHLDKGHIWSRAPKGDGTFGAAIEAVASDRVHWTRDEVRARMAFALRCAYVHGSDAIRTHIDSNHAGSGRDWEVFCELRDAWRGRIALQAVSIVPIGDLADPAVATSLANRVAAHGGILGASTRRVPDLEAIINRLFVLAEERDLALDFHVDETDDPQAAALDLIAGTVIRRGFSNPVVVGHCCSLALQPDDVIDATLDAVAEAGLNVVSLPAVNLHLQDRYRGRTPRWRGVTLLHEMHAKGIRVSIGGDNVCDPFHAYGDHDMLQVYREATRIAHLDSPIAHWPTSVASAPAAAMGLPGHRIEAGAAADFILFAARNFSELFARPQADRIVIRNGMPIETTLPDFAELDPYLTSDSGL